METRRRIPKGWFAEERAEERTSVAKETQGTRETCKKVNVNGPIISHDKHSVFNSSLRVDASSISMCDI